jgi:hypothetical protein
MTTPRDLMIVTIDATPSSPAEQGDLSLALKIEKANPRRLRLGSADRSDPRLAPRTRPP